MSADTHTKIVAILDALAIAYGGESEYSMGDIGGALHRHRRNKLLPELLNEDLAGIAAGILADKWSWADPVRKTHWKLIIEYMEAEEEEDLEKAEKMARHEARKPAGVSETSEDFEQLVCCKIVQNLATATGALMHNHPRMVGIALHSAIDDGDLKNDPERLAKHCCEFLFKDATREDGLQWIAAASESCKKPYARIY